MCNSRVATMDCGSYRIVSFFLLYFRSPPSRDRLIELANDFRPVNLCQGFPTIEPPSFLLEALSKAALDRSLHQYTYVYVSRGQAHIVYTLCAGGRAQSG